MKRIKIAQIGIGHDHAIDVLTSLKKPDNIFDFAGCCIPDEEKEKFSYKLENDIFSGVKMLTADDIFKNPSIDAVIVETYEEKLTEYALMAAKAKKHVHMDKPGGFSPDRFTELVKTLKNNNLVFHTGYMYRYNPFVADTIKKVREGYLGEIFSVEAQMNCPYPDDKRRWLSSMPGGMMFFLGCHMIDLVLTIRGIPDNITVYNRPTGINNIDTVDYGFVVFEYKNGISFVKTCSAEKGGYSRRQLIVNGEKGSIWLNPLEEFVDKNVSIFDLYTEKHEYMDNDWGGEGIKSISRPYNRYDAMLAAFAKMVMGEIKNPYTYEYEMMLYKVLLKCSGFCIDYKSPTAL